MSWATKTASPRPRSGRRPSAECRRGSIKALAEEWASKRTSVVIGNGGPGIRGPYATEAARLQNICLAMQGLGKPGVNQVKMIEWGLFDFPDQYAQPKPFRVPNLRTAYTGGHPSDLNDPSLPKTYVPKAILEGKCDWWGCESETAPREDQFVHRFYPAEGCSKIHAVWTDSPSWITCWNSGNDYVRAMQHPDIEFMWAQHPWLENDALLADIILPVNTKLEEDDIAGDIFSGQYNLLFPEHKCIEPLGESFSDYEIVCMLADRLGLLEEYTHGKTIPDLIKYGYETSRCADLISWEDLNEKGYLVIPTADGWENEPAGFQRFYEDPKANPLTTPTGLLEFESTGLKENFPNDLERPPVPKWIAQGISHEETIGTERSKKYPHAGLLQPSAVERPLAARGHHLAARDSHLQDHRARRIPVPAGVAAPGDGREARHQARRRGLDLQRPRHRAWAARTSPSASCPTSST